MSRFIIREASSVLANSTELPIMRAALRISLQVSSSLVIVRTIDPSATSVSCVMSEKGYDGDE